MKKVEAEIKPDEMSLEQLVLQCKQDKYKLAYSAIRWAKEIKQKESLPDPVQAIVPRALREILLGKVLIADVEKLPMAVKITSPAPAQPSQPTITLNVSSEEAEPVA